jgi:L-idonate 5-dehydrogenase
MRAAVLTAKQSIQTIDQKREKLTTREVRIKIGAGGICGSDLHYFHHYKMGDFPVREAFILGHEAAGIVEEIGTEVKNISIGDTVAINPSHPCRRCQYCLSGNELLCGEMRFLGSSRKFPHIQGMFSETFIIDQQQCFVMPKGISLNVAAFAEPLAVALHAINNAGSLLGANILISGSGPIGGLILLAAKLAGAVSVTMTDIRDGPLLVAKQIGANNILNIATGASGLIRPSHPRGLFDVAFEASGSKSAVLTAIQNLRPGGTLIQVGTFLEPNIPVPADQIMVKELTLKSSFRFDKEFAWAVDYLAQKRIDVMPLLSHTFPIENANEAFLVASDRDKSMKVHLTF